MANSFYDHTTVPATGSSLSSATIRAEFDSVEAGFDKLLDPSGNGNKIPKVNSGGTAYTSSIISDNGTTATVAGSLTASSFVALASGQKLNLDGVAGTGNTYLIETSADVLDAYAGGTKTLSIAATGAAVTGTLSATGVITSTVSTGTAPFTVSSTTQVANLNAATAGTASAVAVGSITGLGTGVATALAVNVGSAGAPVVLNGVLGTPSSGTLSGCSGYPAASTSIAGLAPQATAPTAGLYNYLGITNGESAYTNKALFDATVPEALGVAAAGTAATAARRDHVHTAQTTITGNAGSATYASAVTVAADATAAEFYPLFVSATTGNLAPKLDAGLTYNPSTNILTVSGSVAANVTGNVTGNASGSAGTCTGNAGSATYASAVTVAADATAASFYPLFVSATTGNLAPKLDADLTYNPSTNTLTATTFVGALTGTASGNLTSGGALGTPSGGTLTNCTGLPVGGVTMNTGKLLGRGTAGSGVMEEITLGTNLSFTGTTLNAASGGSATLTINGKTGAYTVDATDLGEIINCTANSFTVSLTAAATLGAGFNCWVWNTSNTATHVITIDPSGAETIDGVATKTLYRGEGIQIVCDGSNWQTGDVKANRSYAENMANSNTRPIASGSLGLALGNGASESATYAHAFGSAATATATAAYAIGHNTSAGGTYSLSLGTNSGTNGSVTATGAGAMALGGSYASGADSFAAAIVNNTSSYGAQGTAAIALSTQAKATGVNSVSIGNTSIASNTDAFALGHSATASGEKSMAFGSYSKAEQWGKFAFCSYIFAAAGDAQAGLISLIGATTTNASVVLASNGVTGTIDTTNQLICATNKAMTFTGTILGKQTGSANTVAYTVTGTIVNNAGTVTLPDAATITAIGTDHITLDAAPTIAADNTNKGLTVNSGNKTTTAIRWICTLYTSEVVYA